MIVKNVFVAVELFEIKQIIFLWFNESETKSEHHSIKQQTTEQKQLTKKEI